MVTLDFETRSEAKLRRVGAYAYAAHPSTRANCLAFAFDDEDEVHLWHPAFPGLPEHRPDALGELFDRVALGDEVEAHNAMFERCVWRFVMRGRHGWPEPDADQWRCSAAKAASYALPRSLDGATSALGLAAEKDMEGNRLALKLAKPRKPRKAELRAAGCEDAADYYLLHGPLWHEDPADLERLFAYCRQDVRAERALSRALRDLPPAELAAWRVDQIINLRGVHCDRDLARAALEHARREVDAAAEEVRLLTAGLVSSTTKRAELLDWVRGERVNLPDAQAATLDHFLGLDDVPAHVRRVLELWRRTNRTSTRKYAAMLERACADGRIRDLLRYHGASTGRWAGAGVQPQNFPRGSIEDMEAACRDVLDLEREDLTLLYGDVMDLLAGTLRGALCAPPGRDLVVADYSAIEARGTFWLADDRRALEVFRRYDAGDGPDIYKVQAADAYGITVDEVTKPQRQLGKVMVLGLGYQMGAPKFQATATAQGAPVPLDDEEVLRGFLGTRKIQRVKSECNERCTSEESASAACGRELARLRRVLAPDVVTAAGAVRSYREAHPEVVALWRNLEAAAIEATLRGRGAAPVPCGRTLWGVRGRFLHCRLPSGRLLSYCDPWVEDAPVPWSDVELRPKLHFWGIDTYTHKWSRQATYGGKLTENVVQATCRDLLRDAMLRAEAAGYGVVLTVHDELACEVPEGWGSVRELEELMTRRPAWADGMPIAAEGWRGKRYRK